MNTQKQIVAMVVLMFVLGGSCAAYTAIDLPYRADLKADYHLDESIERGALLFANNCRTCHGAEGQGGVGLPLATEARLAAGLDDLTDPDPLKLETNRVRLRRTLYCGRASSIMQPWLNTNGGSLNAIQIEHLINFLTDPAGAGWEHALEFSHNLNHESSAVIGGDTLASLAKMFRLGVPELIKLNPGYSATAPLPKGTSIKLPANAQFPKGRSYKVTQANETLLKIADTQHVGEIILLELNADRVESGARFSFKLDAKKNVFTLLKDGRSVVGLYPGTKLEIPDGASYAVVDGDTVKIIAAKTGLTADQVRAASTDLGSAKDDDPLAAQAASGLVLSLPKLAAYEVKGQSLKALADTFGGLADAAAAFAEANSTPANPVQPTSVLRIGQVLKIPAEAWGAAPAGTVNDGKACVENAVPKSVYETITGVAPVEPTAPTTVSKQVEVQAHANDFQVTADGTQQDPNKGVVSIAKGTIVAFKNVVGLHTITINGNKEGDDIKGTDTRQITFNDTGKFKITCNYHPDMLAWIFVQ